MALNDRGNTENSGKVFLKLGNGKVTREWREKPQDSWIPFGKELKTRTITKGVNEGSTRYFIEYDDVSGKLLNVELKKFDKTSVIEIYLQDGLETFILNIPEESAYGLDFMLRMENIDIDRVLVFKPWIINPDDWFKFTGKKRMTDKVGLSIYHDTFDKSLAVQKTYSKENPNGLPELAAEELRGEIVYNSKDRDNFLYKKLIEWIDNVGKKLRGMESAPGNTKEVPMQSSATNDFFSDDIDDNDLPF
ncbi:MAG: hypothetical protein KBH21_00445 [Acetoanaerobium sp.]|nr:hypothetical protein [Acetoanaerobium sp.]